MSGFALVLIVGTIGIANNPDAERLAEQAEAEFRAALAAPASSAEARSHFQTAAKHYQALAARGSPSAALYRNFGNAALLAGDLPEAILAYQQGLQRAPNDLGLRTGLAAARAQVIYREESPLGRPMDELRPPWVPTIPLRGKLFLGIAIYTLSWFALVRWRMVRRRGYRWGALAGLVVVALLGVAIGWDLSAMAEERRHPLVVIADDGVLLRKGNGLRYPRAFETPLNRGVEARALVRRGDWLQIQLSAGEIGWVPRRYVLEAGPPASSSSS